MTEASIDPRLLDDAVERITRCAQPTRIVLFGSAVRGNMSPDSDLDFLVVVPDGTHRRETARRIYRALFDLGHPKDVVVVTESDVALYADDPSLILRPALRDGKELYRAA
ncbi:MAG TPA: nucleotidyltransferase domain-containing protein [Candidatus Latescibacteria bacterium]|nr:DNA polymerase beta [Gemmatimonadaceae bacterium]MDP6015797.1 nucleotidyltransferase domain-containing protein [Candidatus Latescibacterota bacterium]HJP31064.1 nucleotidyltransferase domain-containing protein [Candidatus Latescibacterota bacterium]